tara:strand:+ start:302 stop:511 length:210 start_codon:yes stop_codon:yes gene_type:complete
MFFLIKSEKKYLAIIKIPKAPKVPPTIAIKPPIQVPNKKPIVIESKDAIGKLHKIKNPYNVINMNIEKI